MPPLVLIADGFTDPDVARRAVAAVRGGVAWVQLREHAAAEHDFLTAATGLVERLRAVRPEVRVTVNGRLEVARRLGLGLHTGVYGEELREARAVLGDQAVLGYSAHGVDEAVRAAGVGADYVFFSPVYATASKPGRPATGLEALREVCTAVEAPVYALGGVAPGRAAACLEAGAHGVAVLSAILHAQDPAEAARRMLDELPPRHASPHAT